MVSWVMTKGMAVIIAGTHSQYNREQKADNSVDYGSA